MREKQDWMKVGALVFAFGKKGTIEKMVENSINGIDYVYYISVKVEMEEKAGTYHPSDINPYYHSSPPDYKQV